MEVDFVVKVTGFEDASLARTVGEVVAVTCRELETSSCLDLRRLHQVVVAADYDGALGDLSAKTLTGRALERTDEAYARGFAKAVTLHGDGNPELVVVLEAWVGVLLAQVIEDPDAEGFRTALHLLHHELCHVHDANRLLDAFPDEVFVPRGDQKYAVVMPLGHSCWDEYSANKRCSSTANEEAVSMMTGNFADAIERTKPLIDELVMDYRSHADLEQLMSEFERHGGFLLKSAAYVLGYVDGLDLPLEQLSGEAYTSVEGSYFEQTFFELASALREIDALPEWKSLDLFDPICDVVDRFYTRMGFELQRFDDGSLYVSIPLRHDNTPDL